jgi:hypothetical protein
LAIAFLVFMLLTLSLESIGLGLALGLIGLGLFKLTRKRWQVHEASNNGKSNAQNKADNTFK